VTARAALLCLLAALLPAGGCAADRPPPVEVPAAVTRPADAPDTAPAAPTGTRVIMHGVPGGRRIALTFDSNMTAAMLHRLDAGQVPSYANDAVVDVLQRLDTPATFFLSGLWVQRYPELTRRIAADPRFELASHSYAHRGFTARCYTLDPMPAAEMAADVERSFQVLAPFGGRQTRYFRFPGGCYDDAALRAIAPARAQVVQYDDVGGDPFNRNTAGITANVLRQAHDGAVVVLHITRANAPRTADALPAIIDRLRAQGYRLVSLSELLRAP
jgi:peptidoglycan/xylan/chitin deacetylase (PgdA/CDA1 family)